MTTVYVLQLESAKYYVGYKTDVEQEKDDNKWTKKYKPLRIIATIPTSTHIDNIVKEYMYMYGIDNVRGGSYMELDYYTYSDLSHELWGNKEDYVYENQTHNMNYCGMNESDELSSYEDGYDST